jgi:hypothetical protein
MHDMHKSHVGGGMEAGHERGECGLTQTPRSLTMTPEKASCSGTPPSLAVLSAPDLERLRQLAKRYSLRDDGSVRPVADVTHQLRTRHQVNLDVSDVHWLLSSEESPS